MEGSTERGRGACGTVVVPVRVTIAISTGDVMEVSEEITTGDEMGATVTAEARRIAVGFEGKYVCKSLEMASAAMLSSDATWTNDS